MLWISLAVLGLISGLLAYLFARRAKIDEGVDSFYREHGLVGESNPPGEVRDHLAHVRPHCWRGRITLAGHTVDFHWWTWQVRLAGASPTTHRYVAASFAPGILSSAAIDAARTAANEHRDGFFEWNYGTPRQFEELPGGHSVITWMVLDRADVLGGVIEWMRKNLTIRD